MGSAINKERKMAAKKRQNLFENGLLKRIVSVISCGEIAKFQLNWEPAGFVPCRFK